MLHGETKAFLWSAFKCATAADLEKLAREGKLRDLPGICLRVEPLWVAADALFERGRDVDLDESGVFLDQPAGLLPRFLGQPAVDLLGRLGGEARIQISTLWQHHAGVDDDRVNGVVRCIVPALGLSRTHPPAMAVGHVENFVRENASHFEVVQAGQIIRVVAQ